MALAVLPSAVQNPDLTANCVVAPVLQAKCSTPLSTQVLKTIVPTYFFHFSSPSSDSVASVGVDINSNETLPRVEPLLLFHLP